MYEMALAFNPACAEAHNNLGVIWKERVSCWVTLQVLPVKHRSNHNRRCCCFRSTTRMTMHLRCWALVKPGRCPSTTASAILDQPYAYSSSLPTPRYHPVRTSVYSSPTTNQQQTNTLPLVSSSPSAHRTTSTRLWSATRRRWLCGPPSRSRSTTWAWCSRRRAGRRRR